jgi:hypothetical protein
VVGAALVGAAVVGAAVVGAAVVGAAVVGAAVVGAAVVVGWAGPWVTVVGWATAPGVQASRTASATANRAYRGVRRRCGIRQV